jgi:hypothetical protein
MVNCARCVSHCQFVLVLQLRLVTHNVLRSSELFGILQINHVRKHGLSAVYLCMLFVNGDFCVKHSARKWRNRALARMSNYAAVYGGRTPKGSFFTRNRARSMCSDDSVVSVLRFRGHPIIFRFSF